MVTTVNATEIALYIDGVLMGTTELSEDNKLANVSNAQAYLGKAPYGQDPEWAGTIHEFNIYDSALSEEDVSGLFNAGN
jgi:surface antigen